MYGLVVQKNGYGEPKQGSYNKSRVKIINPSSVKPVKNFNVEPSPYADPRNFVVEPKPKPKVVPKNLFAGKYHDRKEFETAYQIYDILARRGPAGLNTGGGFGGGGFFGGGSLFPQSNRLTTVKGFSGNGGSQTLAAGGGGPSGPSGPSGGPSGSSEGPIVDEMTQGESSQGPSGSSYLRQGGNALLGSGTMLGASIALLNHYIPIAAKKLTRPENEALNFKITLNDYEAGFDLLQRSIFPQNVADEIARFSQNANQGIQQYVIDPAIPLLRQTGQVVRRQVGGAVREAGLAANRGIYNIVSDILNQPGITSSLPEGLTAPQFASSLSEYIGLVNENYYDYLRQGVQELTQMNLPTTELGHALGSRGLSSVFLTSLLTFGLSQFGEIAANSIAEALGLGPAATEGVRAAVRATLGRTPGFYRGMGG